MDAFSQSGQIDGAEIVNTCGQQLDEITKCGLGDSEIDGIGDILVQLFQQEIVHLQRVDEHRTVGGLSGFAWWTRPVIVFDRDGTGRHDGPGGVSLDPVVERDLSIVSGGGSRTGGETERVPGVNRRGESPGHRERDAAKAFYLEWIEETEEPDRQHPVNHRAAVGRPPGERFVDMQAASISGERGKFRHQVF